jgi:hypothetical protein
MIMPKKETVIQIALGVIGVVGVLGFYIGLGYFIYQYWTSISGLFVQLVDMLSRSYFKGIMFACVALLAGLVLFKLRTSARIHYGLTEIMFGMLSVIATTSPMNGTQSSIQVLQIGAGVYIIVRGLDNLKIGLDAAPGHSMWTLWNAVFTTEGRRRFLQEALRVNAPPS